MPVEVRLLHDYTVVVRPGLTAEEIREIEADCESQRITPTERHQRLHCCGMRGDLYAVPTDQDAIALALAGNAIPASEADQARLLKPEQLNSLQRRELRQRAIQTGTATGDLQYDMQSARTLDVARKKRCSDMPKLSEINGPIEPPTEPVAGVAVSARPKRRAEAQMQEAAEAAAAQ